MLPEDLVDTLSSFPVFAGVPRAEIEWMAARGEVQRVAPGTLVREQGAAIDEMWVLLDGRLTVRVQRGGGWRTFYDMENGFVSGAMPFSRMKTAPARLVTEEGATLFVLDRRHFPDLIRECPELTSALVHHMLDRSRSYRTAQLHDERMQSLGRLAAGLAHELNNPASGATSHARSLALMLDEAQAAGKALAAARLTDEQLESIDGMRRMCSAAASRRTALELADREEEFSEWLIRHDIDAAAAPALAASQLTVDSLDALAGKLSPQALSVAIRWAASDSALRDAAMQIMSATGRIHDLVSAVKGFTFMDREGVPDQVDIARGLADTVAMLESKWRSKSVKVHVETAKDLPTIYAYGSELNQVWEKLIDNAIDAAPVEGNVTVTAGKRDGLVVVRIMDDGPGVTEENRARIFDPFFTTKPVGSGAGLGLDIARRYVEVNDGDIDFTSRPGHTVFRVRLPVSGMRVTPAPVAG